jgi:FMN phosphatase YigB (HAD superfamily)
MSEKLPVTHAIADVGGVLMHCADEGRHAIMDRLYLDSYRVEMLWSWVTEGLGRGRISEADLWWRASRVFGIRAVDPAEGLLRMTEVTYDEEAIGHLQRLGTYGVKLSLFTNTIPPHAEQLQDLYGRFPTVYRSDETGLRKPDLESFQYVLEQEHARPEATLFFDDKAENVAVARHMGILAVQARNAREIAEGIQLYIPDYHI